MKEDVVEQVHDWFKASSDHLKDWWKEAKECYEFYAGDQLSKDDEAALKERLRSAIKFNRMRPMISAVKGQQIANRQQIQYLPRTLGDAQKSDILTGGAKWVDDECDAEDEVTDTFEDLIICGMGWSEGRMSYDEDIDGKIISAERFHPFEARCDPSCIRRNLKGGKYRMRCRWMDKDDAEAKWPALKDKEPSAPGLSIIDEELDPHDATRAALYENDSKDWYNATRNQVFIIQCQWWELVPIYRCQDPNSGQLLELSQKKYDQLKKYITFYKAGEKQVEGGIKYARQMKKHYYQIFVCGDEELEKDDCPWPEGFTLNCVTGYLDSAKGQFFGLGRGMIDPQRWSNKIFMDIEDIITSNRAGGAFVEHGALVDPRKAEEIWNDPNPLIIVNDGMLAKGAIVERSPIPYPDGLDRLLTWAVQSLPAVTGINQEMMGYAERDQANVLELQRKKAALTVLADLFDSMRRFSKERGRMVFYFMKTYMNDGRLVRITTDEGEQQYVPFKLDDEMIKFDIIIDEAPSSPNQKQETFAVLAQLIPYFAKIGLMPPVETLDYLPLPTSLVTAWKKQMKPDTPKPPDPQQVAELEKLQSETEANKAKAQKMQAETQGQSLVNQAVASGQAPVETI